MHQLPVVQLRVHFNDEEQGLFHPERCKRGRERERERETCHQPLHDAERTVSIDGRKNNKNDGSVGSSIVSWMTNVQT